VVAGRWPSYTYGIINLDTLLHLVGFSVWIVLWCTDLRTSGEWEENAAHYFNIGSHIQFITLHITHTMIHSPSVHLKKRPLVSLQSRNYQWLDIRPIPLSLWLVIILRAFLYGWHTFSSLSLQHLLEPNSVILKVEVAHSSEMLQQTHYPTWCMNPDNPIIWVTPAVNMWKVIPFR